jgi:hypothetical protein
MVLVEWEDIKVLEASSGAWTENKAHEYKPFIVFTAGYLMQEFPEAIHISGSWNEQLIAPIDQIPRGAIRKITPLSTAAMRRQKD